MCIKVVSNCPHALKVVPKSYKTQKIWDEAVSTYPSTIKFAPEWLMTQDMYDKAVNRYFLHLILTFYSWSV